VIFALVYACAVLIVTTVLLGHTHDVPRYLPWRTR
jgi:hypothetical protein